MTLARPIQRDVRVRVIRTKVHCTHASHWSLGLLKICGLLLGVSLWGSRRLSLKKMSRCLGLWSFCWKIELSFVNAQVADLSEIETWGQHMRSGQKDIFVGRLGHFIACSRLRVSCTARHKNDDTLPGFQCRRSSSCPSWFCTSQ